ncbi:hypothetical protein [Luteolibacter soli]|uniref:Uncharacterized protein n=1 Tax=Luteolibacter soli TaxID=3135280 RepID=A0ABU9B3M1_9BACT
MIRLFLPLSLCLLVCQCASSGSGGASFEGRLAHLKAEQESDMAEREAGTLSYEKFDARNKGRLRELNRMDAELKQQDREAAYLASHGSSSGYEAPSYVSRSRSRGPSTVYESDYSYGKTLGGTYQATNRHTGATTSVERPLGGGYRTSSSSGSSVDWNQNLGGGYTGRDSGGGSWSTGQNLGGQRTVTGSNGRTYTREQTLGGGYKWTSD